MKMIVKSIIFLTVCLLFTIGSPLPKNQQNTSELSLEIDVHETTGPPENQTDVLLKDLGDYPVPNGEDVTEELSAYSGSVIHRLRRESKDPEETTDKPVLESDPVTTPILENIDAASDDLSSFNGPVLNRLRRESKDHETAKPALVSDKVATSAPMLDDLHATIAIDDVTEGLSSFGEPVLNRFHSEFEEHLETTTHNPNFVSDGEPDSTQMLKDF